MTRKTDKPDSAPLPPEDQGQGKRNAISVRLPDPLAAALKAYLRSRRPAPTSTAVVLIALEEFLQREGFFTPPDTD